jgi:hypothetical protein
MDHLKEYVKECIAHYENDGAFEDMDMENVENIEKEKFDIVMEDVCSMVNCYQYEQFSKEDK